MTTHYADDELIALLDAPDSAADPHLAECSECRESFDEYRTVTSSFADAATWDLRPLNDEPNPQTLASLKSYAAMMRGEDEAAEPLVAELLAGPRADWMPRLLANDKYRTAGVVRKLMEASDKAIDVMPPDALEISALATEIADKLDPESYPSDTVMKLRGNAWRDRGYCLFYVGDHRIAENAFELSFDALRQCEVFDYEEGRLQVARAFNARALDNFNQTLELSQRAQVTFRFFGDDEKTVAAGIARAHALLKCGRHGDALNDLLELVSFSGRMPQALRGRLFDNVAFAYRESGDTPNALRYFTLSAEFLADSNCPTEILRVEGNVAELLLTSGQVEEAERRLRALIAKFEAFGMKAEATGTALSVAEICASRGDFAEVEKLCEMALMSLRDVGAGTGIRARTAISFLLEAAAAKGTTVENVRYVRRYVRETFGHVQLAFAPPLLD